MRRVSEASVEETQLRGALKPPLNGQATADFKRRHFQLPLSPTPSFGLTGIASGIAGISGDADRSGIPQTLAVEGGDR